MKHTPQIECASHLSEMLTHGTADLAITRAIKLIKDLMRGIDGAPRLTFDSIACSGISGLLFAPPVARKLKKSLIIVRKRKGDHSHTLVEGDRAVKSYIILDDIICSGATIERILGRIEEESPDARCLGFLGYSRLLNDDYPERQKIAWRPASELDAKGYSVILSRQIREDRARAGAIFHGEQQHPRVSGRARLQQYQLLIDAVQPAYQSPPEILALSVA